MIVVMIKGCVYIYVCVLQMCSFMLLWAGPNQYVATGAFGVRRDKGAALLYSKSKSFHQPLTDWSSPRKGDCFQ